MQIDDRCAPAFDAYNVIVTYLLREQGRWAETNRPPITFVAHCQLLKRIAQYHHHEARHEVLNPALPNEDFDAAVRIAQAEFDRGKPDVVVGSSRGGAVAMNLDARATPLVLLCPAWKFWGTARTVKPGTTILHSRADETVPFADSEELVRNSGLPRESLIEVGTEHRLADPESLAAMLEACERVCNDKY